MSEPYWKGGATAVAQIDDLTLGGTWEANDELNITLKSHDGRVSQTLTVVSGSTTIATIVATVVAAFNAAATGGNPAYSNFVGITATNVSPIVRLTRTSDPAGGTAAGVPFTCTVTTTENGGGAADSQTFARSANTANASPYDWSTAANWSTGSVPVNSDSVTIDNRGANYSILYGLDQSGVTLTELNISLGFTGTIGSLSTSNVSVPFTRLRISATTFRYGQAAADGSNASGSQLINIDFGSNAVTAIIYNTRNQGTNNLPPILLKGTHASNSLYLQGASQVGVGLAVPGETSTLTSVYNDGTGTLTIGSGVTLDDVQNRGSGKTILNCAVGGGLKCTAGAIYTYGDVSIDSIDAQGGTIYLNNRTSGADAGDVVLDGGTIDISGDIRAVSFDTLTYSGGKILALTDSQLTITTVALAFVEAADGTASMPA